jgi:hypothetical protein
MADQVAQLLPTIHLTDRLLPVIHLRIVNDSLLLGTRSLTLENTRLVLFPNTGVAGGAGGIMDWIISKNYMLGR